MRVTQVRISHYRSIENVVLNIPKDKPLVLFGPNNAGKSNILSAINRILGERYPTYIEMLESDFFLRDRNKYPTSEIEASFSDPLYYDRNFTGIQTVAVRYGNNGDPNDNLFHNGRGSKIYPSNEQRASCQSFLIDAERNIQSAFNYSSQYSLLSKFSKRIHTALSAEHKDDLSRAFEEIKGSFEKTDEFKRFFTDFSEALKGSVKGFVHSLAVDFSAYDPNNYAKSLRIYAKEGNIIRSFEEFGTGEQQVLLMAFVKAYMQVFTSENFVLIIEEPEAHLHPLALKWLKEYIVDICRAGVQVIISTHSADFIDPEYLDGLVRVYKSSGVTKAIQVSKEQLSRFCVESGAPASKTNSENIIDFYATKLFNDQLHGMFADTVLFVEGATEFYSLPIYLQREGFSLAEHGVEIVNCRGKEQIPLLWRLFKAYGYNCFALFDGDSNPEQNSKVFTGLINNQNWKTKTDEYELFDDYGYFGKDFEGYFRSAIDGYDALENEIVEKYKISSKPGKAKALARKCETVPSFISDLKAKLELIEVFA